MNLRFSSLLPLVLLSVACSDDEPQSSSPVDAGSDQDGAVVSAPSADAGNASPATSGTSMSNDNLTLGLDESADELTIIEQWPTEGRPDASASGTPDGGDRSSSAPSSSSDSPTSIDAPTSSPPETSTQSTSEVETDVWTLVFDTQTDAAASDASGGDAGNGLDATTTIDTWSEHDAGGKPDASASESESTAADAGADPLRLEGCIRVSGERPATTPTLSAPQVAGLELAAGVAGEPLSGSVQFQDQEDDASTLIVQVGSAAEHHVCTLSSDDLEQGAVALDVLRLADAFPDGSHTLYVGVADLAGNVSGYIAGSLTVGAGGAQSVCEQAPRLVIGAVPSQDTLFYKSENGVSPSYTAGEPLAIVASTDLFLKLDDCTQLFLAGDVSGQAAVGWDNCLLVEYRPTPDAPREAVWSYCSLSIFDTISSASVPQAQEQPSVPGTQLTPPVPNAAPFGWPARALDLMRYVPENHPNEFVLNLRLLDFGSVGSTTDIWLTAEPPAAFD